MVELGFFSDERVELLYGVIVRMSPHGPRHDAAIEKLTELLVLLVAGRASVRVQSAFAASDGSEPEPDIAIVPKRDHRDTHPSEALLIIEVADSSLALDRGAKAKLYAESAVPEYWVVNVREGVVEVYDAIEAESYSRVVRYARGEQIEIGALPNATVSVDAFL